MSKKNVEWEWKKLGDVCEVQGGATPLKSNKDFWENGNNPWLTIDDIREQGRIINYTKQHITNLALKKTRVFPAKSILLCCTASVGEYAMTNIALSSNQQFNALSIRDKKQLIPEFLLHFCRTLKETLLDLSEKATIDFVSSTKVKNINIPIPPLDEQKRIVKVLDDAFEKIDAIKTTAETNLQNAKDLFQTTLAQELTITDEKINQGWEEKNIGEICRLISGDSKSNDLPEGNVPYVKVGDMNLAENDGSITTSSRFVKINLDDKKIFPIGTVIFPKRGGAILTNKKRLTSVPICCDLNIMGVIPSNQISSLFLFYFFENLDFSTLFNGAAIPQINNCDINPLKISLPPLPIQKQIVAKLDSLSEKVKQLESNYKQVLADCDELKKSILKKAFNGEI